MALSESSLCAIEIVFLRLQQSIEVFTADKTISKENLNQIVEFTSTKLSADSRGILSIMLGNLVNETLERSEFKSTVAKTRFYRADIDSHILQNYKFDLYPEIQLGKTKKDLLPFYSSIATLGVGTVLSAALSTFAILPSSAVLAVAMYFLTNKIVAENRKVMFTKVVNKYLRDLKKEYIRWLDGIMKFYDKQVNELIRSL